MKVQFSYQANEFLNRLSSEDRSAIHATMKETSESIEDSIDIKTGIESSERDFFFTYRIGSQPFYVMRVGWITELSLETRAKLVVHKEASSYSGPYLAVYSGELGMIGTTNRPVENYHISDTFVPAFVAPELAFNGVLGIRRFGIGRDYWRTGKERLRLAHDLFGRPELSNCGSEPPSPPSDTLAEYKAQLFAEMLAKRDRR